MKNIIFFILFSISTVTASVSLKMNKGWQFVGFPTGMVQMDCFDNVHVEVVWGFDAKRQQWVGYSPDRDTMKKIKEHYSLLKEIDAGQGVWVYSKDAWIVTLDEREKSRSDIILYKGWNLISIPIDVVVSPSLFGEDVIWKYHEREWQLSAPYEHGVAAPPLKEIGSAEALWVYAKQEHTVSLSDALGELHTFKRRDEMETYIETMLLHASVPRYRDYMDAVPVMESTPQDLSETDSAKADLTTGTNVQEAGVDESDILKHNREYLFFYDRSDGQIVIRAFSDLSEGKNEPIASLPLTRDHELKGMYLNGNTLILITRKVRYYIQQNDMTASVMPTTIESESFDISMYNVSNVQQIKLFSTTTVDGNYVESRIVGNELYVVSQFYPKIEVSYPKVPVSDSICEEAGDVPVMIEKGRYVSICEDVFMENGTYYRYDYENPLISARHLIPTINHGKKDLIRPEKFYAPYKLDQYPMIAVISKFSIAEHGFLESVATLNGVSHFYVSGENIYVTSENYPYYLDFDTFWERETIYKFSLGEMFDYKARGVVNGTMLSQFSMSEKEDMLRVATTSGDGWQRETENSVFILTEKDGKLIEVGSLGGLGEEGERIRGVRFVGDKAYIVTFRQTDPFYVLDLSDPSSPQKAGELKINGFSRYLHPVNENYLLTLGRDADETGRIGSFMIQLYDISDPSSPKLADVYRYTMDQYGFDAEYNARAFIYRRSDNLFGITYHEKENAVMDLFYVDLFNGYIRKYDQVSLSASGYESRGLLFDFDAYTYGVLLNGNDAVSKVLRSQE